MTTTNEAYRLAHTARCKLNMAAKEPDRNLRFLLGHAFTLDKLLVRVAEIETCDEPDDQIAAEAEKEEAEEGAPRCTRDGVPARRVSFSDNANRPSGELRQEVEPGNGAMNARRRSPPPAQFAHLDDTDSDSGPDEYLEEDDDQAVDAEAGGLQRFESASAQPPRMIDDEGSDGEDDEDEPKSPPGFTDEELKTIMAGQANEELAELYEKVSTCPCHGQKGPHASKVWDVPRKEGVEGRRMAVIEVTS